MNVALISDPLIQFGGAERVLSVLREIYPDASIFTPFVQDRSFAKDGSCNTSFLQKFINFGIPYKLLTPLLPLAFESFNLSKFDLVISSTAGFAKGAITRPETIHICYCHTPPRFLYGYPTETDKREKWYWKIILMPLDSWLRFYDYLSAQRVNYFVTNSHNTAGRIWKFYRKEATVIYPPPVLCHPGAKPELAEGEAIGSPAKVDNVALTNRGGTLSPSLTLGLQDDTVKKKGAGVQNDNFVFENYFLIVSRLSLYKNVDLAIKACNELKLPLIVVGMGREGERLKKLAGSTVKMLGYASDEELSYLYSHCQALIFTAQDEDFGLTPVEAMSYGKPIIALRSGGVQESIIEGKTGVFFEEATLESLVEALSKFDAKVYDSKACIERAEKFSKERFIKEFKGFVEEAMKSNS